MWTPIRTWLPTLTLALALVAGGGCSGDLDEEMDDLLGSDALLEEIQARDTLVAVTGYNPISYFLYRGEPQGYEYELLQGLADELGVALDVKVERSADRMFEMLEGGEADLIAYRLNITQGRQDEADFTDFIHLTRQVLVQPAPSGAAENTEPSPDTSAAPDVTDAFVEYPFELLGDSVFVPANSQQADRLYNLAEEIGGELDIVEVDPDVPVQELMERVSTGEIDYTVAPEELAELQAAYYGNVTAQPVLGVWQRVAWAVPDGADDFREAINAWLAGFRDTRAFEQIYTKYFEDRDGFRERLQSEYLTSETGRLSDYDDLLRAAVDDSELGWDWRLLASQTFQESRFRPRAQSWAGAAGLLQLMPPTAREFDVADVYDPEQNVTGAVRFLEWLDDYWSDKIGDVDERLKFILASYNTGHGHVEDARRLTEKYGGDPDLWEDVAGYLLKKSDRRYYTDPVVKYGYSRGREPVEYVERILDRFAHYRKFVTIEGVALAPLPEEDGGYGLGILASILPN